MDKGAKVYTHPHHSLSVSPKIWITLSELSPVCSVNSFDINVSHHCRPKHYCQPITRYVQSFHLILSISTPFYKMEYINTALWVLLRRQ